MTDAAIAVLNAYNDFPRTGFDLSERRALAAAIRAAANQVLAVQWEGRIEPDIAHTIGINFASDALHAIATQVEELL